MKKLLTLVVGIAFLVGLSGTGQAQRVASMYTLGGIYDYLMEGVVPTKGGHDLEPPADAEAGDIRFNSLEQILDDIKAQFELVAASPQNVEEGVTFWSTDSENWGLQTGQMRVGGGLLVSGQTISYRTGDDGDYQKGALRDYTDNSDGTVTDNFTGLMWAKDGTGPGCANSDSMTWEAAIDWAEDLSFAGFSDWRLPNCVELVSLYAESNSSVTYIDRTYFPNTLGWWWSSTSCTTSGEEGVRYRYHDNGVRCHTGNETRNYRARVVRDAD